MLNNFLRNDNIMKAAANAAVFLCFDEFVSS